MKRLTFITIMKYSHLGLFLALSLSLTSCGNDLPPRPDKTATSPSTTAVPPATTPTTPDSLLKTGMAYADMRQALLAHGWEPDLDPECKANVVGADYQALCAQHPELRSCQICTELPELSACSGDGHCLMNFKGGDQILRVGVYGNIHDWKIHGKDSELNLSNWETVPTSSR